MHSQRDQTIGTQPRKDPFDSVIRASQQLPEAGTYNIKDTFEQNKGKAATLGLPYEHKYNDNPGPGAYQAKDNSHKKVVSQKMGKDKRKSIFEAEEKKARELPCSANYEVKSVFDNDKKSFSIGVKKDEKVNQNPGPGQYN